MLKIEFLEKEKLGELISFYKSIYSPEHILLRSEFLGWYTKGDPSSIIVAREGDKILGQLMLQMGTFNFYGEPYSLAWASNWVLSSTIRDRGLGGFFVKFLKDQEIDFVVANMVTKEVENIMTYLGFKYKDLNRYLAVFREDVLTITQNPQNEKVKERIIETLIPTGQTRGELHIKSVDKFGADYDKFWQEEFAPKVMGSARSANFLNWRYVDEPYLKYEKFLVYDKQKDVQGLVVLRVENVMGTSIKACRVVEFFVADELAGEVINFLLKHAQEKDCSFLDFYNLYEGFDEVFVKAGILKNDSVLSRQIPRLTQPVAHENWFINAVFYKKTDEVSEEKFLNFKNFYTTSGDGDQDRKNFL